ncbi:uncharacterized protein SEPMUDRAFT_145721 [Sphaerulina musiva SO2202]|uniref:MADS-box domain-containing protein n=1 Tax=Sphaerulina musiva (strain SO2202) TaxID=692275 RepID=N1QLG3_SPHMS|nr:uncharacterized protein SEPMUDRAFT_145721 [Sphaerulina musiva SO2202]EMF16483.1 hypothetical protein SEPMUDRAFT_145721 [Sphaerulina musiva SO2202]
MQQASQKENGASETRGIKQQRTSAAADDDDYDNNKPGRERRKIEIKFIQDKLRRYITSSKHKAGIMKKVQASTTRLKTAMHWGDATSVSAACWGGNTVSSSGKYFTYFDKAAEESTSSHAFQVVACDSFPRLH